MEYKMSRCCSWYVCVAVVFAAFFSFSIRTPGHAEDRAKIIGARVEAFQLKDAQGKERALAEWREQQAIVLVYTGTSCPMANRDMAVLVQLHEKYGPRGVTFLAVNANPEDDIAAVDRHAREFRVPFPVLKDESQALARRLEARTTPEAFLLDRERVVRYRGQIGAMAAGPLTAALDAVLAGKPVVLPVTPVTGCAIAFPKPKPAAPVTKVTFHKEILPILQARCQSCHRPGQAGPFSLMTYDEVSRRAAAIRDAVGARRMPPWLPEPGHGEFAHSRRLTDAEQATIIAWAEGSTPEGDPKTAPPAHRWTEGWTLGKPDAILSPLQSFQLAATGDDEFRVFVLPTNFATERHIAAVEFLPGQARAVHHMALVMDTTGRGRMLDAADPLPGYRSGPGGVLVASAPLVGLWTPGSTPRMLPAAAGRSLPVGADLLLQVHYHRTGKPEVDRPRIGLFFARPPVTNGVRTVIVGLEKGHTIPAGAARHQVRYSDTFPNDLKLLAITPHMHLLGQEMKISATLPSGTVRNLVWIRKWDYRWQETYHFREPVLLPRGTRLDLVAYFDNSAENPLNPNRPPRAVEFGELTTNEMASVILEGYLKAP